jgi:hypothetical protein
MGVRMLGSEVLKAETLQTVIFWIVTWSTLADTAYESTRCHHVEYHSLTRLTIFTTILKWLHNKQLRNSYCSPNIVRMIILSRFRGITIDGVWIGWLDLSTPYIHHSELQVITALSLIYSSRLHTPQCSQSSLVISWQRIYNSITVAVAQPNFFLAISRDSLNSDSTCLSSLLYSVGRPQQKAPFPNNCSIVIEVRLPCCRM